MQRCPKKKVINETQYGIILDFFSIFQVFWGLLNLLVIHNILFVKSSYSVLLLFDSPLTQIAHSSLASFISSILTSLPNSVC